MIEIGFERVAFSYEGGYEAIKDISLCLSENKRILIAGKNGSGKTTLLKHMNGLLKPREGAVFINGIDTRSADVAELSEYVAIGFQEPSDQIFCETVFEEVSYGPRNLQKVNCEELVNDALMLTGLLALGNTHPYDLHPSDRRWLAIGSVIAMDAPCLALDEPTAGMCYGEKLRLQKIIDREWGKGKLIVISSHDVSFFWPLCDRVILLQNGAVGFDGTPLELLSNHNPAALFRRAQIAFPIISRMARSLGFSRPVARSDDFLNELFAMGASLKR